ncbi:MAG TPA: hypothetical protein VIQ74_15060 [Gemmatimonadaceae bacterium]
MLHESLAISFTALALLACESRASRGAAGESSAVAMGEIATDTAPAPAAARAPESKVESAMGAAPKAIASDAAIMDWPDKEGGQMKQLRAGSNGWVCLPASPSEDPLCMDKTFQEWGTAMEAKRTPEIKSVGVAYMLLGDAVGASNTDPDAKAPTADNQWVKAGPHVMVVVPEPALLASIPTDPKNGGPWVMWKGTKYAHIMVPVR